MAMQRTRMGQADKESMTLIMAQWHKSRSLLPILAEDCPSHLPSTGPSTTMANDKGRRRRGGSGGGGGLSCSKSIICPN